MGLLSIFKRQADSPKRTQASAADASDAVQRARTRARQRLIGAVVLLGIGIVGFPLVFETQPRPIPVNIPIEAPPKDGAPALTMPAARSPATSPTPPAASAPVAQAASTPPKPAVAAAPAEAIITESREEAGREVATTPPPVAAPVASKPSAATPAPAKPAAERKPVVAAADAARAQSLLEGKADKPADAGRFVVQVGAFADAAAAHETRVKVEKLGLKTYTQIASTPAGNRIRVRVGPFASRSEADKALAKARDAGLTAVVLTL
jgi:DedD protein